MWCAVSGSHSQPLKFHASCSTSLTSFAMCASAAGGASLPKNHPWHNAVMYSPLHSGKPLSVRSNVPSPTYTHTHTHTHTSTQALTHAHMHTHARTGAHTRARAHIPTQGTCTRQKIRHAKTETLQKNAEK